MQGGGGWIGTYSFKLEGYIDVKMDTGKFYIGKIGWLDKLDYQKTIYFSKAPAMSILTQGYSSEIKV